MVGSWVLLWITQLCPRQQRTEPCAVGSLQIPVVQLVAQGCDRERSPPDWTREEHDAKLSAIGTDRLVSSSSHSRVPTASAPTEAGNPRLEEVFVLQPLFPRPEGNDAVGGMEALTEG